MSRLVFVDTETTGLNPYFHEVWEVAVIERKVIEHDEQPTQTVDTEHLFHVKPDLQRADPNALRSCRYYERAADMDRAPKPLGMTDGQTYLDDTPRGGIRWQEPTRVAMTLARLLDGAHIAGAVPSFDAQFLQRFLHKHGQAATWHYHLIDVETLAVGYLAANTAGCRDCAIDLPWESDFLAGELHVKADPEARHTALGDARWARDIYDAVMG